MTWWGLLQCYTMPFSSPNSWFAYYLWNYYKTSALIILPTCITFTQNFGSFSPTQVFSPSVLHSFTLGDQIRARPIYLTPILNSIPNTQRPTFYTSLTCNHIRFFKLHLAIGSPHHCSRRASKTCGIFVATFLDFFSYQRTHFSDS